MTNYNVSLRVAPQASSSLLFFGGSTPGLPCAEAPPPPPQASVDAALEIAALGPGGSVCDGATYFYTFLNIATTNFLASETEPEKREQVVARGATLGARYPALERAAA